MSKNARACLTTTVRNPGPFFGSFLSYHLAIGFEKIFVFFDDPNDSAIEMAKSFKGVVPIRCDGKFQEKYKRLSTYGELKSTLKTEVQSRQNLNAGLAMRMALREKFDWIFHLDCDELLFNKFKCPIGELLAQIPIEVEQLTCLNSEAVPQRMDIVDPFVEITYFKKNPQLLENSSKRQKDILRKYFYSSKRRYFQAYSEGKSGARVRSDIVPTVHSFIRKGRSLLTRESEGNGLETYLANELIVYHYSNCGFDQFLVKNRLLVLGGSLKKFQPMEFVRLSMEAYASGDFRTLMKLYAGQVQISDQKAIRELLAAGVLEKNNYMSNTILSHQLGNKKKIA